MVPHLSIARRLDAQKMQAAYALFKDTPVALNFICDAIYIRRFNTNTKQYTDIVEKISLKSV